MAKRPGGVMVQGSEPTRSQLIPVLTKWEDIGKKAHWWPAIFCIATLFALDIFTPHSVLIEETYRDGKLDDPMNWVYTSWYLVIVAVFLTMASLFFIYRQVGKNKSWWILFLGMGFTAYFVWLFRTQGDFDWLYLFFHRDLAGGDAKPSQPLLQLFMRHLLGTGFFEEFTKGVPILLLAWLTPRMSSAIRAKIGIEEPLDGILIGAASGGGFAIVETLTRYVSDSLAQVYLEVGLANHGFGGDNALKDALSRTDVVTVIKWMQDAATQVGTSLEVPYVLTRSVDLAFGHMAYSGYFG